MTDAVRLDPRSVAAAFNDCINARDLVGLTALMTDDHTNAFVSVRADGDIVTIAGHSECRQPALAGPARWTATVQDGKVARWQVSEA